MGTGLALTRSFWWPGRYVVGFDGYAYSGPNLEVTERAVRSWRLPLVADEIFAGAPHLGNPQAGALYLPRLLTLLLETNRAMGVLVAVHVVILGLGVLVLSRRLSVGTVGATTAAVVTMASGAVLTKSVQFEQILVLAWAPALLAAIHAVLTTRAAPWRAVATTALITAAVLLAGHPQLVYETIVLATIATIGFSIGGGRWRRLPHVALGAALGALMAAPQLVAALVATSDSAIGVGRDLDTLRSHALSLDPNTVMRAVLGTVQDRDPASFAGGFESITGIGVVAALLGAIGIVEAICDVSRRAWAIALASAAALSLFWSLGPRSFLFRVAYELVPGFDLARASARWLWVAVVVVALFVGVGVDAVARRVAARHLVASGLVAAAIVAATFDLARLHAADRRSGSIWIATALVVMAALALTLVGRSVSDRWAPPARTVAWGLIALAVVELGVMSIHSVPQALRSDTPFTEWTAPTTEWLVGRAGSTVALTDDGPGAEYQVPGLRPNANILSSIPSVDGYDGGVLITERWADSLRRFSPDPPTELPLRNSLEIPIDPAPLARLGVRWILLDRARPADLFVPGWIGPRAVDDRFEVWENPDWIGDAVAWPAAQVADPEEAPDLLRTGGDRYATTALVDELDRPLACTTGDPCEVVALEVDRRSPEHVVVDTSLDRRSIVMLDRQALPGWRVEVDGRGADEILVDGLFLGVDVPAGSHEITWRYEQPWLLPALAVSLLALFSVCGLLVASVVGVRRRDAQAEG